MLHNTSTTVAGAILLFGEILADVFPDKTVLGGAPFNVARHLKAFGQRPILISRVGHDDLRDRIAQVMQESDMDTAGIQCTAAYPTGRVQVHLEEGGHRFEILPSQAYDYINPALARLTAISSKPELVYFGTLAQRNNISSRALKTLMRASSAPKFLDINLRTPWYSLKTIRQSLEYADVVKLNSDELGTLASLFKWSSEDIQGRVRELMSAFELEQVIVTVGAEGARQFDANGSHAAPPKVKTNITLVDTVGAGDGFAAIYLLGMMLNWTVSTTLERANAFAVAICGIRGAIPEHAEFYEPFSREWGL